MKFSAAGGWFSGDWYNRIKEGAANGFSGVEQLGWLGLDFDLAKKTLDDCGVTSTAIVIQSVKEENMKLTAWGHGMTWEDSRAAFIESFRESVVAAKAMNVPNIIATTGNERFDVSREEQFDICVGTLREMANIAEAEGIMIVLEPLNVLVNHAGYFLVTTEEAVRMIKAVDSPNCKILFDIYHQQISEGNVIRNLTENIDLIGHFHIGDNPGRNQPGTGELNYTNIFKAIEKTGYDRWLAFECGRTVEVPELSKAMHELIDPFAK
jgi:hydroxypyruvate isomerase